MTNEQHPNPVELEAVRSGEAEGDPRAHVDGCRKCRAAIDELGALADRLRGVTERSSVEVPPDVDRAIVERLRAETARAPAARIRRLRWAAAAAAVLLLTAGVWHFGLVTEEPSPTEGPRAAADPMDVDRSGGVDIVDAYLVARRLGRGEAAPPDWDANRDGGVDRRDVDVIARAAVSAEGGRR